MNDLQPLIFNGIDSDRPLIIAGPCSAETHEQTLDTARRLCSFGVRIFRAGIWKPRTKPGGFEGIGAPALEWLNDVKRETGMLTSTECANKSHVQLALQAGVDIIWIGARTSANPFAMQEIADTIQRSGKADSLTVLVKNPVNPDIELWIGALQRIYNSGVRRIGAIHRGFSTVDPSIYRNAPQWKIPIELRLRYPSLPIICDPSHIGGRKELIAPISQQALDMGFDGLIIESHCCPDKAWSDAEQQVTPESLHVILESLAVRNTAHTTESLSLLRQQIDSIDNELIDILSRRMAICREIGTYKKEHNMPVVQPGRYNNVIRSRIDSGKQLGMDEDFLKTILLAIHDESVRQQIEIINDKP
ncbi:MAG: bifunctional 3-deoxy-7-phosphoheptulonate synthase/chorismate mutase type II [Bacteroides sp.]|nr:bifunctional 3-deoxy-7-phosphoheptulonate synthase/chorismate mutase type II [Bacteroides sp.]MCM1413472.1 bifunctional 3-deoxy-7-phosphoheptulonate synthase/chorismate mutase type II [Bacteroides sp.]MCM1471317.1 bifunctional 3-deoxy-7-phosphoheptulonate synthase/chorismate mutase type II [Bacteroides sp.]